MIFKKDNFWLGAIMGLIAPVLGIIIFKMNKFRVFSFSETFQYMFLEPGFKTLTVALSLSLLLNALLFTIYINARKDKTAKGIFATTVLYGLLVLIVKTFG
jgi:hypothetical protein